MKVVAFSDTHNKHEVLSSWDGWLPPADVLAFAGDMSGRGTLSEINNFLNWFLRLDQYKYKIFIPGNHDFLFEREPEIMKKFQLPENVYYLNDSGVEIEGVKFWGSPITPWFHNWAFNRFRGEEIKAHWNLIPKDTNFLITHGAPHKILDEVIFPNRNDDPDLEYNVGCKDLREKIDLELADLRVNIFGHIHEAAGELEKNGVRYYNCSFVDFNYKPAYKPFVIEI